MPDWRVVLAVACLALVAGTSAGVAPALLAVRESVTGALGRGMRTGPPRAGRLRHALAAVQVALSVMLLVGALLFLVTLRHLRSVDLGFDPAGVTVVTLNVRGYGYTDARAVEYLTQVADVVRRQPGIQAAGLAFSPPLFNGGLTDGMYLPDQDPSQATNVERNGVSPSTSRRFACRSSSAACSPRPRHLAARKRTAGQSSSPKRWRDGCSDRTRRSDAKS